MPGTPHTLGLDLGGTSTKLVTLNESGEVVFGGLPSPCGPGEPSTATDQGVTEDSILIATIADPGGEDLGPSFRREMLGAFDHGVEPGQGRACKQAADAVVGRDPGVRFGSRVGRIDPELMSCRVVGEGGHH